jgi:hypothetical protein
MISARRNTMMSVLRLCAAGITFLTAAAVFS